MAGQFEQTGPSGTYIISSETGEVIVQTKAAKDIKFICNIDGTLKGWRIDGTSGDLVPVGGSGINTALANNSYLQSIDAAGTGYDNLIRADSSDNTQVEAATGKTIKLGINGSAVATVSGSSVQFHQQKFYFNGSANSQIIPGSSTLSIRDAGDSTNEFLFTAGGTFSCGASNFDTAGNTYLTLKTGATTRAIIGVSTSVDSPIVGMTAGDLGIRVQSNDVAFSTDGGSSVAVSINAATSAKLTVNSTTQGFLPPRMTEAERDAIASPAAGLIVYNTTTNKLDVYTTAWEAITSV